MRILWVLPYLPWPATSGGKTRQFNLIKQLAKRGAQITLLVQSKEPLTAEAEAALRPHLEQLLVVQRRPLRHPITVLAGLVGPWPLLTSINGLSRELQRTFAQLLEQHWDVIQIEHSYSVQPYARLLRRTFTPFILTEHNLESSLGGATYSRFPSWAKPFVLWDQWRARRWERKVFAEAQQIIAVTEEDAQAMRALTSTPVQVVVNGVDCAEFAEVSPSLKAERLLFLGNYEYPPNVDAVSWLLTEIMPLVWSRLPYARIAIAGHAMPNEWMHRWTDARIEWKGFVTNLPDLQQSCSAFVAPLRQGGGSKLKVLEAMAAGLPVVSSQQGVSGLLVQHGQEYMHAEEAEQFAQHIKRVLTEPDVSLTLAAAAREYVNSHHDWSDAAQQLEHVYQACEVERNAYNN